MNSYNEKEPPNEQCNSFMDYVRQHKLLVIIVIIIIIALIYWFWMKKGKTTVVEEIPGPKLNMSKMRVGSNGPNTLY